MAIGRIIATIVAVLLISSCATGAYVHESVDSVAFRGRAQTQVEGNIRVTAAVPDVEETQAIFGLPLYSRDIQPVWLEIENRGETPIRFAPYGTDPDYFPPLEVAWAFRGGFSKIARSEIERYLHESSMPRRIPSGETRSGFVFTRANPGTKAFTVDVYSNTYDRSFAFFVPVPGFVADHADVDLHTLYGPDEIENLKTGELLARLGELPCCARDESGEVAGTPVNVILIGKGKKEGLQALLRAGWRETLRAEDAGEEARQKRGQYILGRTADAVFRKARDAAGERNELRLWLTPVTVEGEYVWVGQISHYMARPFGRVRLDPDVDDARMYMLQIMLYSQGLVKYGWAKGTHVVPFAEQTSAIDGEEYFTDGYRAVLWLSGSPVSMLEVTRVGLDRPPMR